MRAHAYLRISEDRASTELGVDRQRDAARELVARRGWTYAVEHVDNDTSAAGNSRRPGFEALLRAVEAGEVDAIVGWSIDRMTRTRRDTVRLIETCEPRGVVLAPVRGSEMDLGTPAGRLSADILASVAAHEIAQKSDRQKAAYAQAARLGRPASGPRPFGFADDRVTHHPTEAAALREAYAAVLRGASLASVARAWNAAGLQSGRRRIAHGHVGERSAWSAETVKKVLTNPRNAGLRAHRDEIIGLATWTGIVDEQTWRATVAELNDRPRARQHRAPNNAKHLLSGVATCGVCGGLVNAGTGRRDYFAYRCRDSVGHVARRGDDADAYVSAVVVERLSRPDALELLPVDQGPDVATLREQAVVLRTRLGQVAEEFADDDTLTPDQLRRMSGRLRERLAEVESQLTAAGRMSALVPVVTADDAGAAWEALSTEQRRELIRALAAVVLHPVGRGARTFDPVTVEIKWHPAKQVS